MPSIKRFQGFKILLLSGWLIVAALIVIGAARDEGELSDKNTIKLLDYGLSKRYIRIVQERPGEPLRDVSPERAPTQDDLQRDQYTGVVFNEEQWQRVKRLVSQSVAIANWGLGDPFGYREENGMREVNSFRASDFDYKNPYLVKRTLPFSNSTITWSQDFNRARRGWHVVSRNLMLILRPDAKKDEVIIGSGGAPTESVGLVAKKFLFKHGNGLSLRLSIDDAPSSKDEKIKSTKLRVDPVNASGEILSSSSRLYQHGESFLWNGKSFIAFNMLDPEAANRENNQAALAENGFQSDGLVFTKYINGKPTRTHLLGEATTNLLGIQLGSYITSFDGALEHSRVKRIELTIDPELQAASFFFLRDTLDKLDSIHPFGRARRGAVTILDANTGGVLTHAGYPSIGSEWASKRRVLVERDEAMRSPADDAHMTGSTIKVLTVSMGYLLFGDARSELLPGSDNALAIRQAYQDAYGVELNAPLEGKKALVTPAAEAEFNNEGTPRRIQPGFPDVLKNVYQVLPDIPERKNENIDPATRELIIGSEFIHLFDEKRLLRDFYPYKSRFPVFKAESMERFRQLSLGGWECRFTMLRLAAVLGTAASGKVMQPYIVRSALTSDGQPINKKNPSALTEINVSVSDVEHRREKMKVITADLHKVLAQGGTGYFFTDKNEKIYLGADNPHSPGNEAESRKSDFGKSGTADYDAPEKPDEPKKLNDSLFVYQHGRYLIAVWLEQSDVGDDQGHPDHPQNLPFERHTAHTLTNKIVSLIESIEER